MRLLLDAVSFDRLYGYTEAYSSCLCLFPRALLVASNGRSLAACSSAAMCLQSPATCFPMAPWSPPPHKAFSRMMRSQLPLVSIFPALGHLVRSHIMAQLGSTALQVHGHAFACMPS